MHREVLLALIMLLSAGVVATPAAGSQDEWPDRCDEVEPLDPNGTYNGTIDTSGDRDVFKVRLNKGEYLTISALVPEAEGGFNVYHDRGKTARVQNVSNVSDKTNDYNLWFRGGVRGFGQFWWEQTGVVCFGINDADPQNANIPYEWRLSLAANNPEPVYTKVTELQQRITELEQNLSKLQNSTGDVTFNITVTPGNGSQQFVDGGFAIVAVDQPTAKAQQLTVRHGEGIYPLGQDGRVAVPLAQTGRQDIVFEYANTTETVTINVSQ